MEFTGRVYFDFTSREVYRFYRLLVGAQREGAVIGLEWRGFPASESAADRLALAAGELVRAEAPELHGGFVQAVLASVHLDGAELPDGDVVRVAARAAGIGPDIVTPTRIATKGGALLAETVAEALELGVSGVPTIYRHGPVVKIKTTPAVDSGSLLRRLELIDGMLEDDGLWELTKP